MKPKRASIIAGTVLTVTGPQSLALDAHLCLFGKSVDLPPGEKVEVMGPPKRDKDGINLVPVRYHLGNNLFNTYSCFYIDLLKYTSI